MYNAFRTSMDSFKVESMTTDQFVSWLVTNEWDERCNRMIERLIKQANFRYKAYMEEMDYSIERGLDRNLLERLAELTFVREGKDPLHYRQFRNGQELYSYRTGIQGLPKRDESAVCKYSQTDGATQGG